MSRSIMMYGAEGWARIEPESKRRLIQADLQLLRYAQGLRTTGEEEWAEGGYLWRKEYIRSCKANQTCTAIEAIDRRR
eukprot:2128075-Prorocentrum_lima.AAC.1